MYIDKHDTNGTKIYVYFDLNPCLINNNLSFTPDKFIRYS